MDKKSASTVTYESIIEIKKWIEENQAEVKQAGRHFNLHPSSISNRLGVLNLPKKMLDSFRLGIMPYSTAKVLKAFINNPEVLEKLYLTYLSGIVACTELELESRKIKEELAKQAILDLRGCENLNGDGI